MATLIDRDQYAGTPSIAPGGFPTAQISLGGDSILLRLNWSGEVVAAYTVGDSPQTWRSEAHPWYKLLANV